MSSVSSEDASRSSVFDPLALASLSPFSPLDPEGVAARGGGGCQTGSSKLVRLQATANAMSRMILRYEVNSFLFSSCSCRRRIWLYWIWWIASAKWRPDKRLGRWVIWGRGWVGSCETGYLEIIRSLIAFCGLMISSPVRPLTPAAKHNHVMSAGKYSPQVVESMISWSSQYPMTSPPYIIW